MKPSVATWLGFGAMCAGMFMAILDIQVVASSLTNIGTAFDVPVSHLTWIQTGYLMAEVIAIPLTGLLTRAFTLGWMFAAATLGFTLASLGCALSTDISVMIALRVFQGFCGGMLIPPVFTSVFIMIPEKHRVLGTTIAGAVAMIAPAIGPVIGGYLTEAYSWRWIFLVNIPPGLCVAAIVARVVRAGRPDIAALKKIDFATMIFASVFLAALELILNEGPGHDWGGSYIYALAAVCIGSGALGLWRALNHASPFIDMRRFRRLSFSVGCGFSFVLGFGLYGSIYLLSVFLGLVRGHTPLVIGEIMVVTGISRLMMAPFAALLEVKVNARLLMAFGFGVFGIGVFINGFATAQTDFAGLFWPQLLRGAAMMLCLLPATRLALDGWPDEEIADASGFFNLMRNLGGAIGIAMLDTIMEQRTPGHVSGLVARLQAGDPVAARLVGLPVALFHNRAMGPVDEVTRAMIAPLVRRAALAQSINEAWFLMAALFAASLLMLPAVGRARPAPATGILEVTVEGAASQ
ncbi:MAG TPA: DHA2 family efflux MFS transporter permease subunit [Rhizomicrobium sp.]|nr:DHA2 family efflux MFS transporter permease subunit [Rhizomicrobium sp.]